MSELIDKYQQAEIDGINAAFDWVKPSALQRKLHLENFAEFQIKVRNEVGDKSFEEKISENFNENLKKARRYGIEIGLTGCGFGKREASHFKSIADTVEKKLESCNNIANFRQNLSSCNNPIDKHKSNI